MTRILVATLALALSGGLALAEDTVKASKEESGKVAATLAIWGCEATEEIEKEKSGIFELDDVKCKDGQYDVKLGADFKIQSITRD